MNLKEGRVWEGGEFRGEGDLETRRLQERSREDENLGRRDDPGRMEDLGRREDPERMRILEGGKIQRGWRIFEGGRIRRG